MRLLVVSFWCPDPPDNGSRLRALHLLRQLARRGHEIRLLALAQRETEIEAARENLAPLCPQGVTLFPSRFFRPGTARALAGFLSPRPRHLLDTHQPDFAREVAAECRSDRHDVVFAMQLGAAHYVPADAPGPCVLDELEISPFLKAVTEAASARARLRRTLTLHKLRAHLRTLARRYALWTVVSEAEKQAVRDFVGPSGPPLQVLPNGVDLEDNVYDPLAPYDPDGLVYNGALSFAANADAVRWFAETILPVIRRERPSVCLRVTGRTDTLAPEDSLRQTPGITLTGFLDDVRPTVRGAAVCVVPLRQGGGTRLKILEAMSLGVPVVSTTRGAEGLGATDGRNILLADAPEAFAAASLRLLRDPALRAHLGAAGRQLVEDQYGWDALVGPLDNALASLAGRREKKCQ